METASKKYFESKNLREDFRDLLLLYCWEQLDKLKDCAPMGNPQTFTLKKVIGQAYTQLVIHQVHEGKVIKTAFQTAIPQDGKLLIYHVDNAYIMLSEQDENNILTLV